MPRPGFERAELKFRYDVESIHEDDWHAYSGDNTARIIKEQLETAPRTNGRLLNAGCGVYALDYDTWLEIKLDLFHTPIRGSRLSVCGTIERLPFRNNSFEAVVCIGEVLAYCDPASAFHEFARTLSTGGLLIMDFGNSKSLRRFLTPGFGRAADLITEDYNGSPERTWIYDPRYLVSALTASGFKIEKTFGTHTWSGLARRVGTPPRFAVLLQRWLSWIPLPVTAADLITIVAVRG